MIRTRFAPSPTGRLHLGHAMAAWVAHELARETHGHFLLRHEDIDGTRAREEFYQQIEYDLHWLGLAWDEPPLRQTSRIPAYEGALEKLHALGVIYPCFCTRREITKALSKRGWRVQAVSGASRPDENILAAPHQTDAPTYPGTCRNLSSKTRADSLAAGLPHSWRLDSRKASCLSGPLHFTDLIHDTIRVDPDLLGDVILARKDIGTAYHLAVVVDDAFQKISHITRGEDLLPSTHIHRLLQSLLGLSEPIYLHHPLVLDDHGKRLSKRNDALSLAGMREAGKTPESVLKHIQDTAVIRAIKSLKTSSKV